VSAAKTPEILPLAKNRREARRQNKFQLEHVHRCEYKVLRTDE